MWGRAREGQGVVKELGRDLRAWRKKSFKKENGHGVNFSRRKWSESQSVFRVQ